MLICSRSVFAYRAVLILCLLAVAPGGAKAISVSLVSITELPGTAPAPGTYTTPGGGTSTWDHARTVIADSGSAPTVPGAFTSVELRDVFAITSDIDGPASSNQVLSATVNYRVVVAVTDDDPINDPIYAITYTYFMRGGVARGVDDVGTKATASYSIAMEALELGSKSSSPGSSFGSNSYQLNFGRLDPGPPIYNAFTGDHTFTFNLSFGVGTDVVRGATGGGTEEAVLGGLDGTNPLIGDVQRYPALFDTTDPSNDGVYLQMFATIRSVPEPSTFALTGIGTLGLLAGFVLRRLVGQDRPQNAPAGCDAPG